MVISGMTLLLMLIVVVVAVVLVVVVEVVSVVVMRMLSLMTQTRAVTSVHPDSAPVSKNHSLA